MIEQVCRKERQYGMKIREIAETKRKAKEWFASYTADYDMEDPKIALKAVHTYHVAELCQTIAESLALNEVECMAAWLSGLLHDVGRFEQIRRFNTFSDADSIDHALLSTEILFGTKEDASCGRIRQVILDPSWDIYLYKAPTACHRIYPRWKRPIARSLGMQIRSIFSGSIWKHLWRIFIIQRQRP